MRFFFLDVCIKVMLSLYRISVPVVAKLQDAPLELQLLAFIGLCNHILLSVSGKHDGVTCFYLFLHVTFGKKQTNALNSQSSRIVSP